MKFLSSSLRSLVGMPLAFLQAQKSPHTNRDDRKTPEQTKTAHDWLNNLEKRLVVKDKDKLKGLLSEVAYTCPCQLWRGLSALESLAHSFFGYTKQEPYLPPYLWSIPTDSMAPQRESSDECRYRLSWNQGKLFCSGGTWNLAQSNWASLGLTSADRAQQWHPEDQRVKESSWPLAFSSPPFP